MNILNHFKHRNVRRLSRSHECVEQGSRHKKRNRKGQVFVNIKRREEQGRTTFLGVVDVFT